MVPSPLLRPLRALTVGAVVTFGPASCTGPDAQGPTPIEVAVAASFAATADTLARLFERQRGVPVRIAVGSTGSLYAQIVNGAPHHLFLAADTLRPRRLEREGHAVVGSRLVYARGRLVVWAPDRTDRWTLPDLLREPGLRVAWAEPRTAPYGAAARAALVAWGLEELEGAVGENVGQTLQFVRSGAADVGFVAASQLPAVDPATVRPVPRALSGPLLHEGVLLEAGRGVAGADDFLTFLSSPAAVERIRRAGYDVPPDARSHTPMGAADGR